MSAGGKLPRAIFALFAVESSAAIFPLAVLRTGEQLFTVGHIEHSDMLKAILGIGGGLALAEFGIVARVALDPTNTYQTLWVILALSSWPIMGWGAFHFAKRQGFGGAVGVWLFVLAMLLYLYLVYRAHNPWVYASGIVFTAAFPVVVVLALPKRAGYSRRKHHKQKGETKHPPNHSGEPAK